MIQINIDKAREIIQEKIREAREPLLAQLDVEFMRTLERGQSTTEIVDKKQRLRDATELDVLLSAQSLDELKASWPTDLLGESPFTTDQ